MHDDADGKCADVTSVTVRAVAKKGRDLAAEAEAERVRLQYAAHQRMQKQNRPKADVPLSPRAQQTISAIANAAPTTCGGGVFGYVGVAGGKTVKGLELEGFGGYLGEYDSNTGWSNTLLVEGGVHGGHGAPGYAGSSGGVALNKHHFEPLLFAPVAGAAGLVGSPSGAGFYVGTSFVGAAPYVNIMSNAACNQVTRGH